MLKTIQESCYNLEWYKLIDSNIDSSHVFIPVYMKGPRCLLSAYFWCQIEYLCIALFQPCVPTALEFEG